jgi:hypothetical protein
MKFQLLAHLMKQESVQELQTIKKFDIAPESVVFDVSFQTLLAEPVWLEEF